MDKKFRIYVVDGDNINITYVGSGGDDEIGYSEIRDAAFEIFEGDDFEELTKKLVSSLNNSIADNNYYFVCDAENEIILFW